jgi:hypothetical protein
MIKKILITISILNFIFIQSQDSTDTKTGFNFGGVPAIGYDADLGLIYGVAGDMYNFGDGALYPRYDQKLNIQLVGYTKGSKVAVLEFDGFDLIPNTRVGAKVNYTYNQAYPFYGFNGYKSVYSKNFEDQSYSNESTRMFYRTDLRFIFVNLDFTIDMFHENFKLFVGLQNVNCKVERVKIEELNEDDGDDINNVPTLYDKYVDWGIITEEEKDGGNMFGLKTGLIYDSRNQLANPTSGMRTELIVLTQPDFLGNNDFPHTKLGISHKQFFSIVKDKLSYAYRLWFHSTLGDNKVPFYSHKFLTGSRLEMGMGGAFSVPGVFMNRVVGRDVLLSNNELRWRFHEFKLFNQNFYLTTNLSIDFCTVTRDVEVDMSKVSELDKQKYFDENESLHFATTLGLKTVMNDNFVIRTDLARPYDKRDGNLAFYLLFNFLF